MPTWHTRMWPAHHPAGYGGAHPDALHTIPQATGASGCALHTIPQATGGIRMWPAHYRAGCGEQGEKRQFCH